MQHQVQIPAAGTDFLLLYKAQHLLLLLLSLLPFSSLTPDKQFLLLFYHSLYYFLNAMTSKERGNVLMFTLFRYFNKFLRKSYMQPPPSAWPKPAQVRQPIARFLQYTPSIICSLSLSFSQIYRITQPLCYTQVTQSVPVSLKTSTNLIEYQTEEESSRIAGSWTTTDN